MMNTEKFENVGINLNAINDCFGGNEEIYFKFLKKFFDDRDYVEFNKLMLEARYEEAFNSAHAIKGLTGNLGMTKIYEYLVIIVEKIRNSNFDEIDIIYARCKLECDRLEYLLKQESKSEDYYDKRHYTSCGWQRS